IYVTPVSVQGPDGQAVVNHIVTKQSVDGTTTPLNVPGDMALAADASGNFWADWLDGSTQPASHATSIHEYAANGDLLQTIALPCAPARILPDGLGGVWVASTTTIGLNLAASSGQIVHVNADGSVGAPISASICDLCVGPDHALWVATGKQLLKYGDDGST